MLHSHIVYGTTDEINIHFKNGRNTSYKEIPEQDGVIYAITVADLEDEYNKMLGRDAWANLDDDAKYKLIRSAVRFFDGALGEPYSWVDIMRDSIQNITGVSADVVMEDDEDELD